MNNIIFFKRIFYAIFDWLPYDILKFFDYICMNILEIILGHKHFNPIHDHCNHLSVQNVFIPYGMVHYH